jgi:hypothetical protein
LDARSEAEARLKRTRRGLSNYAKKFRSLVTGVFKINGGKAKHNCVNGGYQESFSRFLHSGHTI